VPLVNPATVAVVPVTVVPASAVDPMKGVTTYEVMGLPPSAGAVHVTVADPSAGVAETPVGVPGAPNGVTELDGGEIALVPIAFVAVTVKV